MSRRSRGPGETRLSDIAGNVFVRDLDGNEENNTDYVVQPGDTLWRISAVSGISLDELRRLNNLTAEDVIREGQTLLLGFGGPSGLPTQVPAEQLSLIVQKVPSSQATPSSSLTTSH